MEAMHQSISSEVHATKQEASSMEEWKIDLDCASNQAAVVLKRLHEQLEDIRYALLACNLLYAVYCCAVQEIL